MHTLKRVSIFMSIQRFLSVYNISNTTLIFPIFNKTNVILDSHCTFHKGNDRL